MMGTGGFARLGSSMASLLFFWTIANRFIPTRLTDFLSRFSTKLSGLLYPYVEITINEFTGELWRRNVAFTAAEAYLSDTCSGRAKKLKAELKKDGSKPLLCLGTSEEVTDVFRGAQFWWYSGRSSSTSNHTISLYPDRHPRRHYRLTFHQRHRQLVAEAYLPFVVEQGKAIGLRSRQRKLYTNDSNGGGRSGERLWSHVVFNHPASFETLAMEPGRKREIMDDLAAFRAGKEYYARIGKAWKRGYLLYGPPGTGKSTMIAAMAKYLDYDVYDLELTTVSTNTDLRKLLIETTGKSIIVIEDIDCSLDLAGKRKSKKGKEGGEEKMPIGEEKEDGSKVTLSGLLNFIDGLWSACGGERLIVFTTNHVEKLDPALIRRGRMDMHIEMSYCTFGAFKVLAKNYLGVDDHPLFESVRGLMEAVQITPADVAENLTTRPDQPEPDKCLQKLIKALALQKAKEKHAGASNNSTAETLVLEEGVTEGEL